MDRQVAESYLRRARQLAARARERTWPNPMVGAVVVRRGRVVGEGYHHRAGLAHAEIEALRRAGRLARGADLYVTLEPCHCLGCTGACTEAIIAAGIKRVFIGTLDPNPREQGRSVALLRRAGLEVEVGICEQRCRELNEVYNTFITQQRCFVLVKAAASLDGRIAARGGNSQWISSLAARTYAHRLRARAGAVMVGAGTVRADDPALDVRHVKGRNPAVAVIDRELSTSPRARLVGLDRAAPVWIYTSRRAPARRIARLEAAGARVVATPLRRGRLDLGWVLADLFGKGVYRLLVEGGGRLIGGLLQARLVDRLELVLAGRLLGSGGVPLAAWPGPLRVAAAPRIEPLRARRLGPDWLLSGPVAYQGRG